MCSFSNTINITSHATRYARRRFGERCAAITNTVAAAATNATDAKVAIDRALKLCENQVVSLEKRNMQHLQCYFAVKEKYATLKLKRGELGE